MRTGVPCNENRFFPVRISTQRKENPVLTLFWPCTGLQCSNENEQYDPPEIRTVRIIGSARVIGT